MTDRSNWANCRYENAPDLGRNALYDQSNTIRYPHGTLLLRRGEALQTTRGQVRIESASLANAIVVLYATSAILGAFVYFHFRVDVMPALERTRRWEALGLLELKEHFATIGLALLPAYWVCWGRPQVDKCARARAALTAVFAFIVWWGFLVGHVLNNIMGFGS